MGGGDLYALDFDGILCDSCGESSLSALKAAKLRWSALFDQVDAGMEDWIIEQMHIILPWYIRCSEICKLSSVYCHDKTGKYPTRIESGEDPTSIESDTYRIWVQGRFADALLREIAGVTIPSDRIFGPKVEVLKQLQSMPEHEGLAFHFVEDRLATLKNVIKEPALDGWNLYLGGWGYNTEKERREAESIPRIRLLDLSDFSKKLK